MEKEQMIALLSEIEDFFKQAVRYRVIQINLEKKLKEKINRYKELVKE